jgi:glycosyltransferase involved in cell wall biosynthesis
VHVRSFTAPATPRRLIVVPAWNEETVIRACLEEIRRVLPTWDVVVVSDGSTDRTSAIVRSLGIPVIDLPFNLGVGGARRAGFSYAVREGYDEVLQIDGDGQHDPVEVAHLVDEKAASGADVVIGARFAGRGEYVVRGPRRWAMKMLSTVLSRVCKTSLTDVTSGLQLCGPRAVALYSKEYPAEYLGDTVEAIVIAARSGLVVRQAGVSMRERIGGAPSHSPLKSAIFLVRAMVALAIALTRPRRAVAEA